MRRQTRLLVAMLLFASVVVSADEAQAAIPDVPLGAEVTVVSSDEQAIVVALTVGSYEIETLARDGSNCELVQVPGMDQSAEPGPQVPVRGVLLGLPTTEGVTLQVIEVESETLAGRRLCLAPRLAVEHQGLDVFSGGEAHEEFLPRQGYADPGRAVIAALYPSAPATLGEIGYVRDQAVAQVQFSAAQQDAARDEVKVHRRIVVRIAWDGAVAVAAAAGHPGSPIYEQLLQSSLLNYADLQRPEPGMSPALPLATAPQTVTTDSAPPALKIGITQSGIYRLGYADLNAAGWNPASVDPRSIRLTHRGVDIPILVSGEADGVFNADDHILFYGAALRDAYTARNVYWLTTGAGNGLRMAQRSGALAGAAASPADFPTKQHAEEDTVYWQTMPGQNAEDRWYWGARLSPNTQGMPIFRDYPITLGSVSPSSSAATLRVGLKGYTTLAHRTRIYLNGAAVDERAWQGQVPFMHQIDIPHSLLRNGANTVRVEALNAQVVPDQSLVNWVEVEYRNAYVAEAGQLLFGVTTPGRQQFQVRGFTQSAVTVFDISDPRHPAQIINPIVESEGGGYRIRFEDQAAATSLYLALGPAEYRSPADITLDRPSAWRSPGNGADYIIITHGDFSTSATRLASHRQTDGLRVATVNVEDIYDEFNDGIFNPSAIRDFLKYAYSHWVAPAPSYVLLIGDASQDYKDNLHTGTRNYVPSQNIESSLFGEVPSDNWYAAISGDDPLPDMLIGRLAAQSTQEADAMVSKIIAYDLNPPTDPWNKRILFVADDNDPGFAQVSEQLAAGLPYGYAPSRIYVANYPPGDPRAEIIDQIHQGRVLVNYLGHGEYYAWGKWNQERDRIFALSDVDALQNDTKLPVIIVGDCLNGFFAGPKDNPSLAEGLQRRQNGGAVAVWAPTELGYPDGHRILLEEFYHALFVDDHLALGAATTVAKLETFAQSSFWGELIETYVLFGDPATKLGIPPNVPYIRSTSPTDSASGVSVDQMLQVVFSKPMAPDTLAFGVIPDVTLAPSWNRDFTALSFSHPSFERGTRYEINITGRDNRGLQLAPGPAPNPWSFTVTADSIPPEGVLRVKPGADPSSVWTNAVIEVEFTEPVRPISVAYSISPPIWGSLKWENDGRHATFVHEHFQSGQDYTFTILTARDMGGNLLQEPLRLSFTVGPTFYLIFPLITD